MYKEKGKHRRRLKKSTRMRFCKVCNNMLYMRTDNNRELTFYCKNCNFSLVEESGNLAEPVMVNNFEHDDKTYQQYLNKVIRHDVTLPRVSNIACPNKECSTHKAGVEKEDNEVIYVKHDAVNMKFLYFCCKCERFWGA